MNLSQETKFQIETCGPYTVEHAKYWFNKPILTQFFYPHVNKVQFYNLEPLDFITNNTHPQYTEPFIVAVFRIKLKTPIGWAVL